LAFGALPGGDLDGVGQHIGSVVVGVREDALDDLGDQGAVGRLQPARQPASLILPKSASAASSAEMSSAER